VKYFIRISGHVIQGQEHLTRVNVVKSDWRVKYFTFDGMLQ